MPRRKIATTKVPAWEYHATIAQAMKKFEEAVEGFRKEAWKAGRNLRACRRARTTLQNLRNDTLPELRKAIVDLGNQLDAARHGLTLDDWMTVKRAKEKMWREEAKAKKVADTE